VACACSRVACGRPRVARACGVSRQTAMTWQRRLDAESAGVAACGHWVGTGVFDAKQAGQAAQVVVAGARS